MVQSYDLGREDSLAGIRPQLPDEDYMRGYNDAQMDAGLPTMQAPSDSGRGKKLDPNILKGALPGKIRGMNEARMAQQDILYLGNLLKAYPGTFRDWPEFCDWYDEFVMDLRVSEDEFMDDFLYTFDLMDCPGSLTELLSVINDPGAQSHPKFSAWANALRSNF